MHIGVLQTGHAPEALRAAHGDYGDMFRDLLAGQGLRLTDWDVEGMQFPPAPDAADGWLITGSKHGAYEDHGFIPPLEDFVRAARAAAVPMVGICFGHQIMAQALGGRVEKFSGGWAVGPQSYAFGDDTLDLNAWHQDQVIAAPTEAEVIAHNDFCALAGLRYGDWGLSVQPHPEFDDAFIEGLIATRGRGLVPDAQLEAAATRLDGARDSERMAARIAHFFKQGRG